MRLDVPSLRSLRDKRIVLASGSLRRKEILANLGLNFKVIPSTFPETLDKSIFAHPRDYVSETALQKSLEVFERLLSTDPADLVIGADTIVVLDSTILEKPRDSVDALHMLRSLRGRSHSVLTAVAMVLPDRHGSRWTKIVVEETGVVFANVSDEVLEAYVRSGEPLDKAGAYGIQGLASCFISRIDGDYWNVVGFPTCRFFSELEELVAKGLV